MAAVTGCATKEDSLHSRHHLESSMDMKAMCAMHEKMKSTKTPEEQKAMMDEHMKTMSPESMQKHMEMMAQCK